MIARMIRATLSQGSAEALFDFVASGKGFIGFHCASDTFHSPNYRDHTIGKQMKLNREAAEKPADVRTPYIKMVGGNSSRTSRSRRRR